MDPAPSPTHDAAALLERCRLNLMGYQDATSQGQLCACVAKRADGCLVAVTTDGDHVVGTTIETVVAFLVRQEVIGERLTMPDWRDGDIAPNASEQIAIRSMLRRE